MLLRHSLLGLDIAEHPVLLLIVSSHAATTNTSRCGLGVIFQQPARQEAKTNHQAHSMVTLSSPRRLLLRPLFLRRLPLHHLLRPVLPERGHQQLPSDQRFLGRGILDVFCACPMVRLVSFGTAPTIC